MPDRAQPTPGSRAVDRLRNEQAIVWREIRRMTGKHDQRRETGGPAAPHSPERSKPSEATS